MKTHDTDLTFEEAHKGLLQAQKRDQNNWQKTRIIGIHSETLMLHRVMVSFMGQAWASKGLDPRDLEKQTSWDQWPRLFESQHPGCSHHWPDTPNKRVGKWKVNQKIKHKKGGVYTIVGFGNFADHINTNLPELCLYTSTPQELLWIRPLSMFTPDRFLPIDV